MVAAARFRPTIDDVIAAQARLGTRVWRTPIVASAWLSDLAGARIWLKLETVQTTGSFKFRGALNAIARLRETRPEVTTVTTASAGNHGAALAAAGALLGVKVRVHLPATAPAVKKQALARLGAVVIEAPSYDAAEDRAREEAASGVTFVSAYSDSDVIAGAGTVALEMLDDRPELDTLIVPLGGGGLLSGAAIVARARRPEALVIGAEAAASPVFTAALAAGRPVTVEVHDTLADGLAGNMAPDSQTFGIVRDLVDRVVRVPESVIADAMRGLATRERLIAEGAAAVAVGALFEGGLDLTGRSVGIIVSGRNTGRLIADVQ
jgi:threonine dehydratase